MSFREIPTPSLNFKKVVISVWFMIPPETAAKALVEAAGDNFGFGVFHGVVPLITFGGDQFIAPPGGGQVGPVSPTFVGVQFFSGGYSFPVVNIQTNDFAVWSDSNFDTGYPEYLGGTGTGLTDNGKYQHMLLSWDLGAGNSSENGYRGFVYYSRYSASSKMWFAVNDVNYDGLSLPAMSILNYAQENGVEDTVFDPHVMVSDATLVYLHPVSPDVGGNSRVAVATSFGPLTAPSIFLPAPATLLRSTSVADESFSPVRQVIMAELQIFTGVTLDTSIISNRRAFVGANGLPVDPAAAIRLLGKRPDIAFTGNSQNWINGIDTGSDTATTVSSGVVTPYLPNPKLGS